MEWAARMGMHEDDLERLRKERVIGRAFIRMTMAKLQALGFREMSAEVLMDASREMLGEQAQAPEVAVAGHHDRSAGAASATCSYKGARGALYSIERAASHRGRDQNAVHFGRSCARRPPPPLHTRSALCACAATGLCVSAHLHVAVKVADAASVLRWARARASLRPRVGSPWRRRCRAASSASSRRTC